MGPALGMAYCFEASVRIELGANMFDVIVKGSRADIKSIGNGPCACNSPLVREY
jgi:hypothetical protein